MVGYFVVLSKAFDCVDRANLIEIIAALSVVLSIDLYKNGKQISAVKHKELNKPISAFFRSKVPRVSILGSIFFLICINDIASYFDEECLTLFAVDTTFFTRRRGTQHLGIDTFIKLNTLSQNFSKNKSLYKKLKL